MKTFSILFTLLFFVCISGQDHRFGKVSKEELSKEQSTIDPESPAEILYEKMYVTLDFDPNGNGFVMNREIEGRIKIYDKDNTANKFLQQEISMYAPSSSREKVIGLRGVTYNLEGGKITETKIRNSDVFTERKNKYWEVEKFAFADVKNGSVLEYKYTITSPFTREVDRWFFQSEIPVLYSEVKFSHPDFFHYSTDLRGEIRGKNKTSTRPVSGMNYNTQIDEFVYQNVPGLKRESFVLNPNNLKASIRFELMMFSHPGFITENYTMTWNQIGKDLMNHEGFGSQLKGNSFLDETVQSITANLGSQTEKMLAIFDFVKNNYSWNGFNSFITDNGIRKTFKDKSGNCADINLMLVSMLQKAGINAHPVVLSTVNNLIINYSFPSVTSLNYVIVSAEINNGLYLMDATEKMSKVNMLPLRDLNYRGFRVLDNGSIHEISLANNSLSNVKEVVGVVLNPDGTISGNYNETKDEYFAMVDNMVRKEDPKKFESEYLSNFSFDTSNFKIDENQTNGMVRYAFKFENIPGGEVIGNKILINPLLFSQITQSSFQYETRNYPLEFGTQMSKSRIIRIKIPDGYKVESLPQENQFLIEGNHAGYVYKVIENNGYIEAVTVYQVNQSILPASYYKAMKEFETKQINTENQQVVLVKI